MTYALYVTHPQVRIEPDVPVPRWGLSAEGWARAHAFADHPLVRDARRFVSSRENKALQLASCLADPRGIAVESWENFGENDRSSTGFVPQERFVLLAERFFGAPNDSAEGWETAAAAQARIVAAVEACLALHDPQLPIVFCGHGAVGTLLKCALAGRPIALVEDQRFRAHAGGGNVFLFRLADRRLFSDWVAMEDLPPYLPY